MIDYILHHEWPSVVGVFVLVIISFYISMRRERVKEKKTKFNIWKR